MSFLFRLLTCPCRFSSTKSRNSSKSIAHTISHQNTPHSPTYLPIKDLSKHRLRLDLDQDKRLIFVGDIHGCFHEFMQLLEQVEYNNQEDHLILLGDLTGKGPHGLEVLRYCYENRSHISIVKGNHEVFLLQGREDANKLRNEYKEIALQLTPDEWQWIADWPLVIQIDSHKIYALHAGMNPSKALHDHTEYELTSMRDIDPESWQSSSQLGSGRSWAEIWDEHQENRVAESERYRIFFGHDAVRGFQKYKHCIGLDTGAVYGRELSAYILPSEELIQVTSKKVYSEPKIKKTASSAETQST